ncbi:nodulation protein NfeD, partial [Planctomycetota bacterium]
YVQRRKLEQWPFEKRDRIVGEETAVFEGELLTMNHTRARELGFCRWIVPDRDALVTILEEECGKSVNVVTLEESAWEVFVEFLASPPMRSLLMFVGVLGVMVEFYHPGMIVPGAVGLSCLALAFFSGSLVGAVDVVDIALVVLGVVLIAVEVFLIPGFGLPGILGLLSLMAGLFLSMQSFTIPETVWEQATFEFNMKAFIGGMAATVLVFAALVRFLPHSPWAGRFVLKTQQRTENGYTVGSPARVALLGRTGMATLRPAGKVEVGEELLDAVAEGDFIEKGTPVEIIETDGNRVVVRSRPDGQERVSS